MHVKLLSIYFQNTIKFFLCTYKYIQPYPDTYITLTLSGIYYIANLNCFIVSVYCWKMHIITLRYIKSWIYRASYFTWVYHVKGDDIYNKCYVSDCVYHRKYYCRVLYIKLDIYPTLFAYIHYTHIKWFIIHLKSQLLDCINHCKI